MVSCADSRLRTPISTRKLGHLAGNGEPFAVSRYAPRPSNLNSEQLFALEEVKALALKTSKVRTSEQTTTAMLFSEPSLFRVYDGSLAISSPPEEIIWESTRTLALLNAAIVDSYVAVYDGNTTISSGAQPWQSARRTLAVTRRSPLIQTGYHWSLRRLFRNIPRATQVPAGGSNQLESASGRNTPFTATGTRLPQYIGISVTLTKHLGSALRSMLCGAHFRFQTKMLCISANT